MAIKKLRGSMARFIISKNITKIDELKDFNDDSFKFDSFENQPKLCYSLKSEKNYSSDSLFKTRLLLGKVIFQNKKIPGANIIVYDNDSSDDSFKNNKKA